MTAWLSSFAGTRTAKALAVVIALLLIVWGVRSTVSEIHDYAAALAAAERASCDAAWKEQIARSSADADRARLTQAQAAVQADVIAREKIDTLTEKIINLEASNAALPEPDNGGGISRARVRLLNNLATGAGRAN